MKLKGLLLAGLALLPFAVSLRHASPQILEGVYHAEA
ncbi:hypothetical protein Hydth_1369 [Hydrogenobacter thermophilus TK-6]|nr:hypothetical protein Hydth_1369 [Hydrogenobacter thermophilus TK-6]